MLASMAEKGPVVPLPTNFELDFEGDKQSLIGLEKVAEGLYRVIRENVLGPLTVYVNCETD